MADEKQEMTGEARCVCHIAFRDAIESGRVPHEDRCPLALLPLPCGTRDKGFVCLEAADHQGDHIAWAAEYGGAPLRDVHRWPGLDQRANKGVARSDDVDHDHDYLAGFIIGVIVGLLFGITIGVLIWAT